jgi:hypothetical protein
VFVNQVIVTRTGDLAQTVIEALREAASGVVEERLREINPLLQNIWARIDPHPAFRIVSFFSQVFRGKGQLTTVLSDPIEDKKCESPGAVLSSSQINALAVSVFLALNVGIPKPPLPVAILDDPLQSLDDINRWDSWICSGAPRIGDNFSFPHMTHGSAVCYRENSGRPINRAEP